ncbi:hypothetical protein PVAG01_09552 [Phlyctema vagabunda]|uniref:Uncharacterized protein n=1 Tax=Phlyctema vagabunda TaxID=108571 RepID=A0ABR4P7N9_9HELO
MAEQFTVIAGDGSSQKIFQVRKESLEKSSVIKGWIEDPDSMPASLQKDGALYLAACEPDVVLALIRYLERDDEVEFDDFFELEAKRLRLHLQGPLYYLRVYKLAGSLAIEGLCILCMLKIRAARYNTETFIKIALEAERGQLVEGKPFRDFMMNYMAQNFETLSVSKILQATMKEGGHNAWAICSLLVNCLGHVGAEAATARQTQNPRSSSNPFPVTTPDRSSLGSASNRRRSSSYAKSFSKPPGARVSSHRVEKRNSDEKRKNRNATVEDAPPSGDDDS